MVKKSGRLKVSFTNPLHTIYENFTKHWKSLACVHRRRQSISRGVSLPVPGMTGKMP